VVSTYARPGSLETLLASLSTQAAHFDELIVVDASPDEGSETAVAWVAEQLLTRQRVRYLRVPVSTRGIPLQRNLGLDRASGELVAFLDDDVRLEADCLERLHEVLERHPDGVGVGAVVSNDLRPTDRFWQLFHALGGVDVLTPGHVAATGFSVPLAFVSPEAVGVLEVERLPGCAMLWRTALARQVRFDERLQGYALGEDLDFSIRAGRSGRLLLALAARVLHESAAAGRPTTRELTRMRLVNQHRLYIRLFSTGRAHHALRHAYAMALYVALLLAAVAVRGRWRKLWDHVCGCCDAVNELVRRRRD
jgi:GT2 family glycosyltransferase